MLPLAWTVPYVSSHNSEQHLKNLDALCSHTWQTDRSSSSCCDLPAEVQKHGAGTLRLHCSAYRDAQIWCCTACALRCLASTVELMHLKCIQATAHAEHRTRPHASRQDFPAGLTAAPFLRPCSLELLVATHWPRSPRALAMLSVPSFMIFLRYKQMQCIRSLLLQANIWWKITFTLHLPGPIAPEKSEPFVPNHANITENGDGGQLGGLIWVYVKASLQVNKYRYIHYSCIQRLHRKRWVYVCGP